jgi:hypothetical protein
VGIDVADTVFQHGVAEGAWRVVEQHRLTRTQMERWFANQAIGARTTAPAGSSSNFNVSGEGDARDRRSIPTPRRLRRIQTRYQSCVLAEIQQAVFPAFGSIPESHIRCKNLASSLARSWL